MRNELKLITLALLASVLTLYSCQKEDQKEEPIINVTGDPDPDIPDIITVNGHDAVNLGLSVRWATCNVDASEPEQFGGYYSWGETETKTEYNWDNYKYCGANYYTYTKYCTQPSYGNVDYKTELDPEDDVAHVKWGEGWRMPTCEEVIELLNNCTIKWTTRNGVKGYLFQGKNGNTIFMPAAGYQSSNGPKSVGIAGFYFTNSILIQHPYKAYFMYFPSSYYSTDDEGYRFNGLTIRPVIAQ